jgi:hypothetical protein
MQAHVALAACVGGFGLAGRAWAEDFTMKLTSTASADLDTEWMELLKKGVEAGSAGKIKVERLSGEPARLRRRPRSKASPWARSSSRSTRPAIYEGLEPRFAALSVPGVDHQHGPGRQGAMPTLTCASVWALIAKRRRASRSSPHSMHSPVGIVSRKPIAASSPTLNGMKIRVPGSALVIEQLKDLGASPIAMSLGRSAAGVPERHDRRRLCRHDHFLGAQILRHLQEPDAAARRPSSSSLGLVNSDYMKPRSGPLEPLVRDAAAQGGCRRRGLGRDRRRRTRKCRLAEERRADPSRCRPADAKQYLDIGRADRA